MTTIAQHATELAQRRAIVAARYLRGDVQARIAADLGVTQQQISLDLKAIRAAWLVAAIRDYDAAVAEELAKIDAVEVEYWAAWKRSQLDKETSMQEAGADGKKKVSLRKEGQAGSPAFLDGVLRCIERRCKLLGLDAPDRYDVRINWEELTDEQLDRLARGEPPGKVLSA